MRSENLLSVLLAAGAALSVAPLTGCAGEVGYVVEADVPPPPRHEVAVHHRGYLWVDGHWDRTGGHWRWRPGYYERERTDMVYERGRWEQRGRTHVWIEGNWRPRASVTIQGRL